MTDSNPTPLFSRPKRRPRKNLTKNKNSNLHNSPWRKTVKTNVKPSGLPQVRLLLVWGVLLVGVLGLGWRVYQLQIIQAPKLQEKARQQQMVNLRPYIPRRTIVDSQNNVLATDRLVYSLYAHPKLFKTPKEKIAQKLAPILDRWTSQKLIEKFNQRESGIRIASALTEEVAKKITNLSLDGLELIEYYSRFYPQQKIVADAIGYVDRDRRGQAGVEYSQRQLLEYDLLTFRIRRAGNGAIMPASLPEGLLDFDDLQLRLTLDLRLQRAARVALKQKMRYYNAKRGTVIVMDVKDGSLLALVCEPTYNPNQYFKYNIELFKNWAVTDLYEPGSTFKPINVAIALEAGVIKPHNFFYDSGKIKVDGWNIYNHDYHSRGGRGPMSIAKILQYSSNVGMIQIVRRMNKRDYYSSLKKLGLGESMGVDLPGDAPGYLKSEAEFTLRSIEAATASFGQGFSLTPLKLLQLHGAIANGGTLVTPHVVQGLADPQGHFHWQPSFTTKKVFSESTTRAVLEMMETVVTKGSGEPAQIEGYRIAGKTGTAQKASPWGGYLPNAKITSFVAILPVESPRYAVVAVIDEPKGSNTFGSTVAAPIVKSVMETLIAVKGIPPSSQ